MDQLVKKLASSPNNIDVKTEYLSPQSKGITIDSDIVSTAKNSSKKRAMSSCTPMAPRDLSSFTPFSNQTKSSNRCLLLSPSRTITETLTALAASTAQQLEIIWDEVGYNAEERASQLSELIMSFRNLCEGKIAEEQGVAETFRRTILETRNEIRTLESTLKTKVNPVLLQENTGQSLTDELAVVEQALENFRTAATAARKDMKEYQDHLVEMHDQLGIKLDDEWKDLDSDLTTERRALFHDKVEEMTHEVKIRKCAIIQLIRDCQHLMKDLRIDVESTEFKLERRIASSLIPSEEEETKYNLVSLSRSETSTGIDSQALQELTDKVGELTAEKRRRTTRLQEMGNDIMILWEKLEIPEEEQRRFTEGIQGLGMDTIEKGEAELERLLLIKSEMLGKLIREARESVSSLWDEINASEEFRKRFEEFEIQDEQCFNDGLLDKHENYILQLQAQYEQMKPILKLIERRELIVRERVEYNELQKDPDRLKQRGAALTRQLMNEEKMARRIKKELPKVTSLIIDKLNQWKEENSEDFLFHGKDYLEVMEKQEEDWSAYKEKESQMKLQRKRQEEKKDENNRFQSNGRPFTQGKRRIPGRVLSNAKNRTNQHRSLSRSRKADDKIKNNRASSATLRNSRLAY